MTRGSVVLVIVLLFLPAVLLTALAVATGGEAPEAHDLVLFAHQLLFVYWLGPDIGVYYLSGRITDPALTVEQRLAAAQTFSMIDLVPRICLSLMLTVGGVLTEYVGIPHPAWQWAGILLLGPFWLTMVLIIYFRQGTPFGATVARFDFWFRGAMIIGILASVTYSWTTGRLADTPWVAGKLILFAAILLFGLLMRVQVRPLIDGIGKMATQGPSAEVDASMATSVARTKPYVLAMWACLLLEALLGVVQPGSPDEPRAAASTAAPELRPPG
jgi:hypothetical protein